MVFIRLQLPKVKNFPYEGWIVLSYFFGYWLYLFAHQENEWMHWLTLVLLPMAGLVSIYHHAQIELPFQFTLRSVGLQRGHLTSGLLWGMFISLAFSLIQLMGRSGTLILERFRSGTGFYLWPLSFLLMCITAATTEEFFFRGILQSRLMTLLRSRFAGILGTALLFGLYHLPYAYFCWPAAGNWETAIHSALETGVPLGLLLGWLYARSQNLLAPIVAHALINSLPGMLIVEKLFIP